MPARRLASLGATRGFSTDCTGTKEIGDGINKVIGKLADANDYLLKGMIDQADFNDESKLGKGKEMQDRLSKLVGIFEGLDFRANRARGDDLLGDAYEYLMGHFATQSGKSKGLFYTPAEVSRIMARVIGIGPANDEFRRFEYGEPPAKNGDLAFLLHLLASLNSTGKGAIIMPHGVLFRGNREADIRRHLVRRGLIKGVIGLPANLFYGTGIPACIVVIDKENAVGRRGIFMIDASKGFRKDGAKNRLRERDIHRIVDVFNEQRETPGYARMVPLAEIASETNDYNLNIPRYIDSSEREDLHDLGASVRIPQQRSGFPGTGPSDVRRRRGGLRVHLGMREVHQGVPKIQQTLSAESPEGVAWRLSVTTLLSDMDAEIAAVEYTAQKTTQITQKLPETESWATLEGGASVDPP